MSQPSILEGLNRAQRDAVTHVGGPLVVVAGAGSGKTQVLTHRIAYLIEDRWMSPTEILAVTFTNKAAREMKRRVGQLVGSGGEEMWVSTFHSACARVLRQDAALVGYPNAFTIYDQGSAARLCRTVVDDLSLDRRVFTGSSIRDHISSAKNQGVGAVAYAARAHSAYEQVVAEVFVEYQRRLRAAAAMDFDDLLLNTVGLLLGYPKVLDRWRRHFGHVLVDEYQDTNSVQNDLVVLLTSQNRQVTVVGDGDQAIYAFRGADSRNLEEFERAFPEARTVVLERNYRSTQNILDAANAVIANNRFRKPKRLWTDEGPGARVMRYRAHDESDEARYVMGEIVRRRVEDQVRWEEMAVLYRINALSRAVEQQLVGSGVPYVVVGSRRFYDRAEVRDALAYLKTLANPADDASVRRALAAPYRGVRSDDLARLDDMAAAQGLTLYEVLTECSAAGVTDGTVKGIRLFLALMGDLASRWTHPGEALSEALKRSGYLERLRAQGTAQSQERLENLAELGSAAYGHDTIQGFLEEIALVSDTDDLDRSAPAVALMTVHKAKGLEYRDVYVIGMEEGLFPHSQAKDSLGGIEEERRLAYVGITRARRRLVLTSAASRRVNGNEFSNQKTSRFLWEVPSRLVEWDESVVTTSHGLSHELNSSTGRSTVWRSRR